MAQVIKLKRTSIAGNIPDTSNIEVGELAFNSNDKSLFIRGDSNAIVAIHDESTLHIDTTNNRIGIGTTSPTQTLDVAGNIQATGSRSIAALFDANHYMRLEGNSSGGVLKGADGGVITTLVRSYGNSYFNGGNFGIGTSSPGGLLSLAKGTRTLDVKLETSPATGDVGVQFRAGASDYLGLAAGGGSGVGLVIDDSNKVGIGTASPGHSLHVVSAGNGEIKAERTSGAAILTQAQASLGRFGTSTNHNLQFMTNSSGHMTITTAGRVGIGTTSPGRPLDVIAATNILLELESTNAGGNSRMVFTTNSGSNWNLGALNDGSFSIFDAVGGANSFIIETGANGNTLVIDSQSRVGIGTAAPSSKLHISESADGAKLRLTRGGVSEWDFSIGNTSTLTGVGSGALEILPQNGSTANELAIGTAGTTAPLVHITNSQNYFSKKIGIGTTSVDEKLHVEGGNIKIEAGAVSTTRGLTIAHTGQTGNLTKLEQSAGGNPHGILHTTERQLRISAGSGGGTGTSETLSFWTNASRAMTIDTSQRVGIGVSSPNSLLHISASSAPTFRLSRTGTGQVWVQSIDSSGRFHLMEAASEGGTQHTRLKIDDSGEITFNEAYTFPTADGSANQVLQTDGSGNLSFATVQAGGGGTVSEAFKNIAVSGQSNVVADGATDTLTFAAGAGMTITTNASSDTVTFSAGTDFQDSDGDTKIQVEESSDEDIIRFDTAGTERMTLSPSVLSVRGTSNPEIELLPNGSVGNADLRFDGTTFDIRSNSSSASLLLSTFSTERMRIDSSGRVGIGTSAPSANGSKTTLHINSDTNGAAIRLSQSSNSSLIRYDDSSGLQIGTIADKNLTLETGDTTALTIDTSQNVGIGTTAPSAPLHVVGADSGIKISSAASDRPHLSLINGTSEKLRLSANNLYGAVGDSTDGQRYLVFKDGAVGIGTTTPNTYTNQKVLTINGTTHARVDFETGGTLRGSVYGDSGSLNLDAGGNKLRFYTGNAEKMQLDSSGRLLIGTSGSLHSSADLQIVGASGNYARIMLKDQDGTNQHAFIDETGGNLVFTSQNGTGHGPIRFATYDGTDTIERMRVHSNGYVGIGTTSPAGALHISGTSAEQIRLDRSGHDSFRIGLSHSVGLGIYNVTDSRQDVMIDGAGKVGIGTTSPAGNLHIKSIGDVGDAILIVEADNDNNVEGDNPRIELRQDGNNVAGYLYVEGTGGQTATNTTDNFTVLEAKGALNSQGIQFVTGGRAPAQSGGASFGSTRMTILGTGNVGIGTTSPTGLLHVSSGTSGDAVVIIESDTDNNDENDNPQLQFKQDGGNTIAKAGLTGDAGTIFTNSLGNAAYFGNDEAASVQLYTNATARLTIESGGDVGIGVTNPTQKLEVNGNIRADGHYYVGGNIVINSSRALENITSITVDDYIIHNGNTGTKFGFGSANTMNFISNGSDRLTIANSYAVFNEVGTDYDFRVESNNNTHMLFVDGGTDVVYFGTSATSLFNNNSDVYGASIDADGYLQLSRNNASMLYLNRQNANGEMIDLRINGGQIGSIGSSSESLVIKSVFENRDIIFKGNDAGSEITALTLDMSAAGAATLNDRLYLSNQNANYLTSDTNYLRNTTAFGTIQIGPGNAAHAHFLTDRSNFYFNKELQVDTGIIGSHNEDLTLRRAQSTNGQLRLATEKFDCSSATAGDNTLMPIGGFVADVPLEENRHFYIPGTSTNELAGANRKHTVTATKNGSAITISDAPFQAGASNYSISTANSDTIIITITGLHLTYGANAGIVFGNTTWRAQDVKIETSTDGGTSWTTRTNQTSQTRTTVHKYFTSGGTATNAIRYTLTNFATSSTRINHLYAYNYNSQDQYYAELYKDHDIYANWEFQDNRVLKFGTGGDLQIYHDNNYSYIREAGTGDLRIAGASNVQIWNSDIDSQMANFANGGAATLYYAGAAKLSTSSTGISVVGGANLYSNTSNNTLNIGRDAGQKLGIYVDDGNITLTADQDLDENGNHNFILDRTFQGTGANNFKIQKDGTDQLTIDTSGTVTIAGNLTVNGTTTTLNTATLDVEDKNITLNKGSGNTSGSADGAGITIQDAVDSNTDATILWNQSISGFKFSHDIRLDDDLRLEFGDSSDLIIRHANNNRSYISGGDIEISTNSFRLFNLAGTTGMITATTSGVNLLQNTSVTGALSVTGNISSGIYEIGDDVTSTSSTSQTTIAQFSASSVRSCRFTVQVTNSTDSTYHTTELLLVHDGTTPGITEFGAIFTGAAAEATFDADISGGSVRLRATPASSDSMTFKVVRHMITT